ncbi:MAG: hypothetical protein LBS21_04165 [Clostridiales bacterium]|jgi:hypothetical protein|nr:hypothetical protein [Clostridiales bacterium]
MEWVTSFVDDMRKRIGQTVTIFTASGGISGSGFTGVLLSVDCNYVRLLCNIGAAPSCPIGSTCSGRPSYSAPLTGNPLGAICVIPMCSIACFTHHAI